MRINKSKRVFNAYSVAGWVIRRPQSVRRVGKNLIIILGVVAFIFLYGVAGRVEFCDKYPKQETCHNVR